MTKNFNRIIFLKIAHIYLLSDASVYDLILLITLFDIAPLPVISIERVATSPLLAVIEAEVTRPLP